MNNKLTFALAVGVTSLTLSHPVNANNYIPYNEPPKIVMSELMVNKFTQYPNVASFLENQNNKQNKKAFKTLTGIRSKFKTGYTTTNVNIRAYASTESDILEVYSINDKVEYVKFCKGWYKIKYNDGYAYISSKYVSKHGVRSDNYNCPDNGWKSYTPYMVYGRSIFHPRSEQYALQQDAYTGDYGIRMIDGRYCVALGTGFHVIVGDYADLKLANGTILKVIVADIKDDGDTDSSNKVTVNDGSAVEFTVDEDMLPRSVRRSGDLSNCKDSWKSRVEEVRVYNKNYFED